MPGNCVGDNGAGGNGAGKSFSPKCIYQIRADYRCNRRINKMNKSNNRTKTCITVERAEIIEPLARIEEVAKLLNVSAVAVRAYVQQRKIPFYKIQGSIRFNLTEIEEWVNGSAIIPISKPNIRKFRYQKGE
jgi:excisionase family DNA binding protein